MRNPNLHRCPETEWRNGREVRCTLGDTHWPRHPHVHNRMTFDTEAKVVQEANEAPVCGRSWQTPHPLDHSEVYNEQAGAWVPAIESVGHVCYETRGHFGEAHLCWCGCTAAEAKKPTTASAEVITMRPRQTMLRSAA